MTADAGNYSSPPVQYLEDPGWRGRVGFISPPSASLDHLEFLHIAPRGFAVYQTMTYVPDFGSALLAERISQAAQQLEHCARTLKGAGMDCIAQCGTPFAFLTEDPYRTSLETQARIEEMVAIPFVMMGLSVVNALKHLGVQSVAVACTYYSDDIAGRYREFLEDAGFRVLAMETFVQQGIFKNREEVDRALFPPHRRIPVGLVYKAARIAASHTHDADAVVISGGAVLTLGIIQALEYDLGKPVVSSLSATCWEIFHRLGVGEPIRGYGKLLAGLGRRR